MQGGEVRRRLEGSEEEGERGEELQGYWSDMGVFEGTTAGEGRGLVDRGEVGEITGSHPTPCSSVFLSHSLCQFYLRGAIRVFEGIPAGAEGYCVYVCGWLYF